MSGKQIYISILTGIFLGGFSAHVYMGLSLPIDGEQAGIKGEQRSIVPVQEFTPEKIYVSGEVIRGMEQFLENDRLNEHNEHIEHSDQNEVPEQNKAIELNEGNKAGKQSKINETYKINEANQIKISNLGNEPIKSDHTSLPLKHGNKESNNYNIIFFGIEDKKLQMLTVYSINQENNWKSGTVFIPTDTLVPGTRNQYMADYFYENGVEKVKQLVEKAMEIKINYYVMVDRNLLMEVEPYLDPIYVGGKKINLSQIFTREITPEDEIILASLLKSLTKPAVYFGVLPKLVMTCKQYIKTDFQLNWTNLWVHYQIARNIDTTSVTKKIISGKHLLIRNQKYWIPTQYAWWNMVYEVTI